MELKSVEVAPEEYDDHALHIEEHTRFLLGAEFKRAKNKDEWKGRVLAHMRAHRTMSKMETAMTGEKVAVEK